MAMDINVNTLNFNSSGWYLYCANGYLFSQEDAGRAYATGVNNGSEVEVIFDQREREISFAIDGTNQGVAFTNLPEGDLYPAADIFSICTLELLD